MPNREEKIGMVIAYKEQDHLPNKNQKSLVEKELSKENPKEKKFLSRKRNRLGLYFKIIKGKLIYKCPFDNCNRLFKEKGNLKTHIRIHTGVRPYICHFENCNKSFITIGNLKSHICKHTGIKPYKCNYEVCNKSYSRLCRYKIHLRTHTGLKPYKCSFPDCDKSFNEKGNLKIHQRIHTGEKPYSCNYEGCSRTFKAHGHLKDHVKRHLNIKPFACDLCEMRFTRNSTLKIHKYVHSGEKPYKCDFPGCSKSFSERGNLRSHQKIHNAKNPYNDKGEIFLKETAKVEQIKKASFNISLYSVTEPTSIDNKVDSKNNNNINNINNISQVFANNFESPNEDKTGIHKIIDNLLNKKINEDNFKKAVGVSKINSYNSNNNISFKNYNNFNLDIDDIFTGNEVNPQIKHFPNSPLKTICDSKKRLNEQTSYNPQYLSVIQDFNELKSHDGTNSNENINAEHKSKFERNLECYNNYINNSSILDRENIITSNNLSDKIRFNINYPTFLNVYCYNNHYYVSDHNKSFLRINPFGNLDNEKNRNFVNNFSFSNSSTQNNINNTDYYSNQNFLSNNININDPYFDYFNRLLLINISKMSNENLFFQNLFKKGN